MLAEGVDTIVLGCTHYPFVIPLIQEIAGPQVRVINPAPAVARQVRRVLESRNSLANQAEAGNIRLRTQFFTTGTAEDFQALLTKIFGAHDFPPVSSIQLTGLN